MERDAFDADAVHIVGELDGEPVAAGRIRCFTDHAKPERIAVSEPIEAGASAQHSPVSWYRSPGSAAMRATA